MPLTHRTIDLTEAAVHSLDDELAALQDTVRQARRNRWHGGDIVTEPQLEGYLAALTSAAPLTYGSRFEPAPAWKDHHNPWRESIPG